MAASEAKRARVCVGPAERRTIRPGRSSSSPSPVSAGTVSDAAGCAELFRFAAEPVPVAKTVDGRTVVGSVEWGYNADHDLCYLVLDEQAVAVLRAAPCDNPEPSGEDGVGIGSDGLPCATRLLTRAELQATGYFGSYEESLLEYGEQKPNVPDEEALSHITGCLRDAPDGGYPGAGGWAKLPEELTTLQACTTVWRMLAAPVNNGGMRPEIACVFDTFARFFFWGDYSLSLLYPEARYINIGWGEACGSWIDPEPDRPFLEKCRWLYGHYIGHELAAQRSRLYDQCFHYTVGYRENGWLLERGVCGDRYVLVAMALLFMHDEARDLGLLPDNDNPVDYMYRHRDNVLDGTRWC